MKKSEFWMVELGVRMGPLVLGTEYEDVLQVLREHSIDADSFTFDGPSHLPVPSIGTHLIFSKTNPRTLCRIDVTDDRLRFATLSVIGKRAHEILGIFKLPRKATLWCSIEIEGTSSNATEHDTVPKNDAALRSREQLARGTIWIPSLGLGLTLRDGLIATVHLCHPADSPRIGDGPWTKEQQRLSEVREIPAASAKTATKRHRNLMPALFLLLHIVLVASIGTVIWRAVQLQRRWDAAPEVSAVVVAVDPPISPTNITVSFIDSGGVKHIQTLGFLQFMVTPKLGDEVNIRYMRDEPDTVLGPIASRDIGFETAIPRVFGIVAIYSFLQVLLLGASYRARRNP